MVLLEKMGMHTISSGNYVTSVNGMIHPDRIMKEHDFLYMLDGSWEICEDHETYPMQTDDLLILPPEGTIMVKNSVIPETVICICMFSLLRQNLSLLPLFPHPFVPFRLCCTVSPICASASLCRK